MCHNNLIQQVSHPASYEYIFQVSGLLGYSSAANQPTGLQDSDGEGMCKPTLRIFHTKVVSLRGDV